MTQPIKVGGDLTKSEPEFNVRVFLYSDGGQFINGNPGKVENPFKNGALKEMKFDPLMMAYIGGNHPLEKEGINNLKSTISIRKM